MLPLSLFLSPDSLYLDFLVFPWVIPRPKHFGNEVRTLIENIKIGASVHTLCSEPQGCPGLF